MLRLRVGLINQCAELVARVQVWHDEALGWLADLESLPQIPGQSPAPVR